MTAYFWDFVYKTDNCWDWVGPMNKEYGRFGSMTAHRFSYQLAYGYVKRTHDIHHLCENKRCVRPDHLQALSRSEHRQAHVKLHKPMTPAEIEKLVQEGRVYADALDTECWGTL